MFLLFVVFAIAIVCFLLYKKGVIKPAPGNMNVSQRYDSEAGHFVVSGKKDKFVITKDRNIAFLVENGQIVACKDKRVDKDFKYYGGK